MASYISAAQLSRSLDLLKRVHPFFGISLLAFKQANMPVGRATRLNFSQVVGKILESHYRPSERYRGYYSPLQSSHPSSRWLKPRYGSTSLQRITKDTFGDVLLHPTPQEWGWRDDYVKRLSRHLSKSGPIPAFDLAAWLFREEAWPNNVTRHQVRDRLFRAFLFTNEEVEALFDAGTGSAMSRSEWLSTQPISIAQLSGITGAPPGSPPPSGAALRYIRLVGVGPVVRLEYEPADRLNLITGDNGLGKTFLLDTIWWVLTGSWVSYHAEPRRDVPKKHPAIAARVGAATGTPESFIANYDWDARKWRLPPTNRILSGLAVYARHDGSFAIWDPARHGVGGTPQGLLFVRDEVWDGKRGDPGRPIVQYVCNGLIADWVLWQVGEARYERQFSALKQCLEALSPSETEILRAGAPTRFQDGREVPTLEMEYGTVPVPLASAAVRRALALVYMLVWSWFEHVRLSEEARRPAQTALVLIVDEAEAHLHPRWQQVVIPALIRVVRVLSPDVQVQAHIATHSPLVMASAEPVFDDDSDALHHLRLAGGNVTLEKLPFIKRGTSDAWLMAPAFGLGQPRSRDGELAIREALRLQSATSEPKPDSVRSANQRLVEALAPDDEFWPRWRFFAERFGAGS